MKIPYITQDTALLLMYRILLVTYVALLTLLVVAFHVVWYPFEIIISFLPQLFMILSGGFCLMFALGARFVIRDGFRITDKSIRKQEVTMLVFILLLISYLVSQAFFGQIQPLHAQDVFGTSLRVGTYNKLVFNQETNGLQSLLAQHPDVVGLQEITRDEADYYARELRMEYIVSSDCGCSAGQSDVFILSRFPIVTSNNIQPHHNGVILNAHIAHPTEGIMSVYSVHLTPPFSQQWVEQRSDMYDALVGAVTADENPVFVLGDFNTTIYSPEFRDFADRVSDKVKLIMDQNWPKCSRYENRVDVEILCVRIDHIFMPVGAEYGGSVLGKDTHSDHLPFSATVVFPDL